MTLEPQVRALRDRILAEDTPPLYTLTVAEARAADLAAIRATGGSPEAVARVLDRDIPGPAGPLRCRVYLPDAAGPLPVLVYLFGGGWTLGTIDTSDGICRRLTNLVGCATVAVGYRLAPEHKFPAAVLDCHAAVRWLAEHAADLGAELGADVTLDATRLAVAGDSAGGNLAAAVTLLAREHGGPDLCAQVLVYPNTDHHADTPSMRNNNDPAFFNARSVAWYWEHYLARPEDGADPLASPLRAADVGNLPPALVVTAELDPLRDEGERYAHRLADAGVPVTLTRYDGVMHGFFTMLGTLDASRRAVAEVAAYLRRCYAQAPAGGDHS